MIYVASKIYEPGYDDYTTVRHFRNQQLAERWLAEHPTTPTFHAWIVKPSEPVVKAARGQQIRGSGGKVIAFYSWPRKVFDRDLLRGG